MQTFLLWCYRLALQCHVQYIHLLASITNVLAMYICTSCCGYHPYNLDAHICCNETHLVVVIQFIFLRLIYVVVVSYLKGAAVHHHHDKKISKISCRHYDACNSHTDIRSYVRMLWRKIEYER